MTTPILYDNQNGLITISLNRPDKLNALTLEMFKLIRQHIQKIKNDNTVRCVILKGNGPCFSSGHDLEGIAQDEEVPSPFWYSETLRMLETLPVPVIAAVHGHCYTGALEVALSADFIVAADNARFGDTHSKFALTPIWGMSQRLPQRLGIAKAKRLMFTSEFIKAPEAYRIGLVEEVIPLDKFDEGMKLITDKIMANSGFSHAANKRLLEYTDGKDMNSALLWEATKTEGVGPDMLDRIASFTKN